MRFTLPFLVVLASSSLACAAPLAQQSNGVKLGEALAFAAAAGAVQVAQSVAEQNARNRAPITHASTGVAVAPGVRQRRPVRVRQRQRLGGRPAAEVPDHPMDDAEARDYVLGYVNGVRKLNAAPPLVRDESLDAFALAGSEQLAQDHKLGQHMTDHARELRSPGAELQGSPDGAPPGSTQDRLAEMLLQWTGEGRGGMHHDAMLRPEWRKVGVGIVSRAGRMYFTVDFTGP